LTLWALRLAAFAAGLGTALPAWPRKPFLELIAMSLDKTLTLPGVGNMGYPIPVVISDIVDEAVTEAALAPTGTTATAAELNTLHGVTAGTTSASKALVVDSNKELDALNVATLGIGANRLAMSGAARAGRHTVTSGEAAAHTMSIATGVTTAVAQIVQILRAGAVVTGDAAVSFSGGNLTVADGASTYAVTASDVVNWLVVGA
jgi:hypothetical protein